MRKCFSLLVVLFYSFILYGQEPPTIVVHNSDELNVALGEDGDWGANILPGTTILIAPGEYLRTRGYWYILDTNGTEEAPITIAGLDPNDPPVFSGDHSGWSVQRSSHLVIKNLLIRDNPRQNGMRVHADWWTSGGAHLDELSTTHHIVLENLTFLNIGTPWGDPDALKISNLDYFTIRNCYFEGWAEQAIDIIASQYGVIEDNQFIGADIGGDYWGENTLVTKSGTRHILIQRNLFQNAGADGPILGGYAAVYTYRGVIGSTLADGSTLDYEGSDIELVGNRFYTNRNMVFALRAAHGTSIHHNTFVSDNRRMIEILRSTGELTEAGILGSSDGTISNNLFVFEGTYTRYLINQGQYYPDIWFPETFTFDNNAWYNPLSDPHDGLDDTYLSINGDLAQELIAAETNGVYGVDPGLDLNKESETYLCASEEFQKQYPNIGADAYGENGDYDSPTTFIIVGTAEANSLIKIYKEGIMVASLQMENGQTDFSIEIEIEEDKENNFLATATDTATNESTPTNITIVKDSTAPDIPIIENPTNDIIINEDTYLIQGEAEENSLVKIYKDNVVVGSEQLSNNKNFNIVVDLGQNINNVFSVTATDKSNNESLAALVSIITEDSIAPEPPIITSPPSTIIKDIR